MGRFVSGLILATAALMFLGAPSAAQAQAPKVLQVVLVSVEPADRDDYLADLKKAQVIFERLGLPAFRVWQATLAGPNTGGTIVGVEYQNLAAFAEGSGKLQADPGWQKWVDNIQKKGISQVTSNSLLVETTP